MQNWKAEVAVSRMAMLYALQLHLMMYVPDSSLCHLTHKVWQCDKKGNMHMSTLCVQSSARHQYAHKRFIGCSFSCSSLSCSCLSCTCLSKLLLRSHLNHATGRRDRRSSKGMSSMCPTWRAGTAGVEAWRLHWLQLLPQLLLLTAPGACATTLLFIIR